METLVSLLLLGGFLGGLFSFLFVIVAIGSSILHFIILFHVIRVLRLLAKWLAIKVKKGY